jgi:hypothetical protein
MVLLGGVDQVEDHFSMFGDSVNLDARLVHGFCQTYHRFRNHFGRNQWYSYVTWVKSKLVLVHLEIVLISMQDRCTVCDECTTGMEINVGTTDGTPR